MGQATCSGRYPALAPESCHDNIYPLYTSTRAPRPVIRKPFSDDRLSIAPSKVCLSLWDIVMAFFLCHFPFLPLTFPHVFSCFSSNSIVRIWKSIVVRPLPVLADVLNRTVTLIELSILHSIRQFFLMSSLQKRIQSTALLLPFQYNYAIVFPILVCDVLHYNMTTFIGVV